MTTLTVDYKQQTSSFNSYKETKIPSSSMSKVTVIRSGTANLRERGTFTGTTWRPKRLELDDQLLVLINTSNSKRTRIALKDITELERTDLTDHSLVVVANGKRYNFSFSSDPELYDWQDDIYRHCPLGSYSTKPFDFVHKSHIGSDSVTGVFADQNILPIYAEIVSGQPSVTRSSSGIAIAPRSRPPSGILTKAIPAPITTTPPMMTSTSGKEGAIVLEGAFIIKQAGLFAGWRWKTRWLTLTPVGLLVHQRETKGSAVTRSISLPSISSIELDPSCNPPSSKTRSQNPGRQTLVLEYGASPSSFAVEQICVSFESMGELYTWRDALYMRSTLSAPIGSPTNFVHKIHVGFDAVTGVFTGLPTEWAALINPPNSAPVTNSSSSSAEERRARRQSRRRSAPLVV